MFLSRFMQGVNLSDLFIDLGTNTATTQCFVFFHKVEVPEILKNKNM